MFLLQFDGPGIADKIINPPPAGRVNPPVPGPLNPPVPGNPNPPVVQAPKFDDFQPAEGGQGIAEGGAKNLREANKQLVSKDFYNETTRSYYEDIDQRRLALLGGNAALTTAAYGTSKELATAAKYWRDLNSTLTVAKEARNFSEVSKATWTARFYTYLSKFERLAPLMTRFSNFASSVTSRISNFGGVVSKLPVVGKVAGLAGGRAIPVLGAALSVWDNFQDWKKVSDMKVRVQNPNESAEEYKAYLDDFDKAKSTAKTDAIVNTSCTVAGAVIGGVIGSIVPGAGTFIGACVGASVGNLVGKATNWIRRWF